MNSPATPSETAIWYHSYAQVVIITDKIWCYFKIVLSSFTRRHTLILHITKVEVHFPNTVIYSIYIYVHVRVCRNAWAFVQNTCMSVWMQVCACTQRFEATLLCWAASCLSDYPASSRCQICHLQMSGRACGAEEWREERGVKKKKKKERKQNNWFCRHLERVQTGHREPQSVNSAQGIPTCSHSIEKVAFRVLGFSLLSGNTASSSFTKKKKKKETSCILQKCLQGCFTQVCFLQTICYHYYYHKNFLVYKPLSCSGLNCP